MMRLTFDNIKFVKELTKDGKTYEYFVAMKSGYVSDSRRYVNYVNGKSTADTEYPFELLPKCVQKFIRSKNCETFYSNENFTHYIYR